LEQLLESLSVFSNQKPNLFIVFQQFNKDLSLNLDKVEKKDLKKKLFLLRKYLKNNFFKEIMNILLLSVRLKNSAQLLADSVAEQISVMKKHNYFLIFLKRALILFLWSKFSRVNGIKISLKGRFNGVLRARKRTIEIGNIPAQELNSNITYHQATSFTSNGTFGVKVWINEKKKKMLLQPKKFKHKKIKKGKLLKFKFKSNSLKFGTIGLKASESGYITARQIESARQAITRKIKRKGKLWIKIFPNLPITSKPTEVRMGKGTGKISHWVARVKGGTIIFEISGVNLNIVVPALKTGSAKLPIKTIIFK
jgi:large subunit ribosomal protein L16